MSQLSANQYGGVCAAGHCSRYVQPGAGFRVRLGDRWRVYCQADAPEPNGGHSTSGSALRTAEGRSADRVPRSEANRFAGACMECSVQVAPGAGVLVPCEDGKRRLQCPVCQEVAFRHARWNEHDQFGTEPWISDEVPAGCADTIPVCVLTLDHPCWKCGEATTCVVALYPHRPAPTDSYPRTVDETSRVWVKELLREAGFTRIADSIKPRWSSTFGGRYLSSGCLHCDALQGDFPLEEEASDLFREQGIEALPTLLVAEVPTPVWHRLVHGEHGEGCNLLM